MSDDIQPKTTETHGQVRKRLDGIGVTLAGTEHILTIDEACGLANALCYTMVDGLERNMLTCTRESSDGVEPQQIDRPDDYHPHSW